MVNAVCGLKCVFLRYKMQTVQSSGKSTFLSPPLSGSLLLSPKSQSYNFLQCPSWAFLYIFRPMYFLPTHAHVEGSLTCTLFCILFFTPNNIHFRVCSISMYLELSHSFHGCTLLHWWIYNNLFSQSSTDGHLSCFQSLKITNNVPLNIFVYISFHTRACMYGPKPLKYYTLFAHLLVWSFIHPGPEDTETNSTGSPSLEECEPWQRWWTGHGRSAATVSGNLRLRARLSTNLLRVPGWMLGIMQTTLFFIPHWILPKPFCVWQLSALFVSLQVSSVLEGPVETRNRCSMESALVWMQYGKTQDHWPLSLLAWRGAVSRLILWLGC